MMTDWLLNPPVAFVVNLGLVGLLYLIGRKLAGPAHATTIKSSTYSSGEAPPTQAAAPGYRPFFVVALFFAMLHLGVLMMASGDFSPIMGLYLGGLLLALLALILG
jgi:NADH:ubiquinone oxidoreductase subunit 3 (subunit A)